MRWAKLSAQKLFRLPGLALLSREQYKRSRLAGLLNLLVE